MRARGGRKTEGGGEKQAHTHTHTHTPHTPHTPHTHAHTQQKKAAAQWLGGQPNVCAARTHARTPGPTGQPTCSAACPRAASSCQLRCTARAGSRRARRTPTRRTLTRLAGVWHMAAHVAPRAREQATMPGGTRPTANATWHKCAGRAANSKRSCHAIAKAIRGHGARRKAKLARKQRPALTQVRPHADAPGLRETRPQPCHAAVVAPRQRLDRAAVVRVRVFVCALDDVLAVGGDDQPRTEFSGD